MCALTHPDSPNRLTLKRSPPAVTNMGCNGPACIYIYIYKFIHIHIYNIYMYKYASSIFTHDG